MLGTLHGMNPHVATLTSFARKRESGVVGKMPLGPGVRGDDETAGWRMADIIVILRFLARNTAFFR